MISKEKEPALFGKENLVSVRSCQLHRACLLTLVFLIAVTPVRAAVPNAKVYVVLWFDTEDYILPASDDAAFRVAEILTHEGIRATFKVVGEKARTLEARGRADVIAALKKHEIGYHSNFHSFQPSPAMYLADLGWDEGVAEFDRRERPGYDDIKRIFGVAPSCYGQPGSSWGPQSYGAMRKWGMDVYLDAGTHIRLDDRPFYYCGVLNLYKLAYLMRADITKPQDLSVAEARFLQACEKLTAEGGGVVSVMYHPCEFVHKEFWDGVNFRGGANPPRDQWRLPRTKTAEETATAYHIFEDYIRFMKRRSDVQFVTASEARKLYRDRARNRSFTRDEIKTIAGSVTPEISFYRRRDYALSAAEIFVLLSEFVTHNTPGSHGSDISLAFAPYGPSERSPTEENEVITDSSQFLRTAADVADFVQKHGRIPSTVWLGSKPVAPEGYLLALARMAIQLMDEGTMPTTISLKPARLAIADQVSSDKPELWRWVIFPPGFRAPRMMELAKRQAWTLKPALLDPAVN
jgi:hypothetical protein